MDPSHTAQVAAENCGYQTPTEYNHPPFFTPAPPPTATRRPNYSGHTFYAPEPDPEEAAVNVNGKTDEEPGLNLSSLDNMLHKADTLPRKENVSIKDRIGCYQWTFFTMVCFQ